MKQYFKKIGKWLFTIKSEIFAFLILSIIFFIGLPLWLNWAYNTNPNAQIDGVQLISPAYVTDFIWGLVKLFTSFLILWIGVNFAFPTLDNYIDNSFEDDWEKISPEIKIITTLAVVLILFLGIAIIIL